jgi:hypothetical protein
MKPYQPSNKVPESGFTWLLLSSVIGGGVIGGLAHLISLVVYLVVLFPLGMGFVGGRVMVNAIRQGKVRNPAIAALFGGLAGLVLYGSMHGGGYLQFRQEMSETITKQLGQADGSQTNQLVDLYLKEKTGDTGFWGYIKFSAQEGVSIGRFGSKGMNLGETGTWIYWLIEFVVIDGIIAAAAYATAKSPFCESCNQWYNDKERIGSVNAQTSTSFLELLKNDQFTQAGAFIDPIAGIYPPNLEVYLQRSPATSPPSDFVLTVNSTALDSKGNLTETEVLQGMLSPSQYNNFQEAMTAAMPQTQEQSGVSTEDLRLAQQERSGVSDRDRFEPHELDPTAIANLTQQLAHYPQIKQAYLVRKAVSYFPEKPFYLLGIVRRKGFLESEDAENQLTAKLMTNLVFPSQTLVIGLNKNKAIAQQLQSINSAMIYQKK